MGIKDSKRKYTVFVSIEDNMYVEIDVLLRQIVEPKSDGHDYEYIYALSEMIDEVMDLKPLDHAYFQSNRDDKNSRGLIVRKI